MRIAILSDIHGNSLALDAVLEDIHRRGEVDGYWVLGDLCAIGFDPVGVLERLTSLPNALFIRGNADRYVITGDRPDPTFEKVRERSDLVPVLAEVSGSFGWTRGMVESAGWVDWLSKLPLEQHITLPDGTRVLLVHSQPETDAGYGLNLSLSDEKIAEAIDGCDCDLICVGHFHMPMDRTVNNVRVINPGSISNNFPPDLRAGYAILNASESGYSIDFYRVSYDLDAAIAANEKSGNPGRAYVIRACRGEVLAGWLGRWDGQSHLPLVKNDY